jgi:hypothetical protein
VIRRHGRIVAKPGAGHSGPNLRFVYQIMMSSLPLPHHDAGVRFIT